MPRSRPPQGVSGARVQDVMRGAGLTVGGFYAHFVSKEALIDETLRRTATELRERLFAGLDDKPEGNRAEVVLKRYLSARHRDLPDAGCPLPSITGEIAPECTLRSCQLSGKTPVAEGLRLIDSLVGSRSDDDADAA